MLDNPGKIFYINTFLLGASGLFDLGAKQYFRLINQLEMF